MLVDFWAPWCGPCRMVAPIVDELADEYDGKVKFLKLNTDDNVATATKYGIRSIPTLMVFKGGEPVGHVIGFRPKSAAQEAPRQGRSRKQCPRPREYDIVIIGGGPAGLAAGLYAARGRHKTVLIEKGVIGGQIALTEIVENYPGIPQINGFDLAQTMLTAGRELRHGDRVHRVTAIRQGIEPRAGTQVGRSTPRTATSSPRR